MTIAGCYITLELHLAKFFLGSLDALLLLRAGGGVAFLESCREFLLFLSGVGCLAGWFVSGERNTSQHGNGKERRKDIFRDIHVIS
jgi:hypothetical protein